MPRKGPIAKREILPDPIYNSRLTVLSKSLVKRPVKTLCTLSKRLWKT